jgi:hypothetical protein
VSRRAGDEGGERTAVIADGRSGEVAVCRVTGCGGQYALRQCKIMYGLCWRNRHRSAPAISGFGHHVKSGSCDMPLRSAAGSAQRAAV